MCAGPHRQSFYSTDVLRARVRSAGYILIRAPTASYQSAKQEEEATTTDRMDFRGWSTNKTRCLSLQTEMMFARRQIELRSKIWSRIETHVKTHCDARCELTYLDLHLWLDHPTHMLMPGVNRARDLPWTCGLFCPLPAERAHKLIFQETLLNPLRTAPFLRS